MKTLHTLFWGLSVGIFLSSCSGISHVTDDDVYVMKSPVLPIDGEVNDESSYQNYRYQRDRGDYDVHYGNCPSTIWSPVYMGYGVYYNSFGGTYSAFNDPFYYPWPGYGYPYGYGYGYGYGGSCPNWQMASFYGYGYYPGPGWNYYNNGYNNYNYGINNNSGSKFVSFNTHSGPRNSISGINNSRRSSASGMKGMAIKPTQRTSADYSVSAHRNDQNMRPGRTDGTTKPVRSKTVEVGRGLSKPGHEVNTGASTGRRSITTEASGGNEVRPSRTGSVTRDNESRQPSRNSGIERGGNSGSGTRQNATPPSSSPAKSSPGRRGG